MPGTVTKGDPHAFKAGITVDFISGFPNTDLGVCPASDGSGSLLLGNTVSPVVVYGSSLNLQLKLSPSLTVQCSWPVTEPTAGHVLKVGTKSGTVWPLTWAADSGDTRAWTDLTATGTVVGDAASIVGTDLVEITGAGGVKLPAVDGDIAVLTLCNNTGATVTLYPNGSDTIQGGSSFPLGPQNTGVCISKPGDGRWYVT